MNLMEHLKLMHTYIHICISPHPPPSTCIHTQGRLAEKHSTVSKDELLTMVKFGADEILNATGEQGLTDEDIDLILQRGAWIDRWRHVCMCMDACMPNPTKQTINQQTHQPTNQLPN